MNDKSHNEDFLIKNAIHCWLYHFPDHEWTDRYKELAKRDTYSRMDAVNEPKPKPRPARRRKATTN